MISYPHYLNYSFLSFLELKKYHLSYQITQITKIEPLFQEQNDKIVTIVTNIIHRFFSFWKKLAHIEPCLKIYLARPCYINIGDFSDEGKSCAGSQSFQRSEFFNNIFPTVSTTFLRQTNNTLWKITNRKLWLICLPQRSLVDLQIV